MPQERYFQNPLSEHGVTHNHDLREGSMNEPAGGETRQEHEANIPKKPTAEALRPSHVFGARRMPPLRVHLPAAPVPTWREKTRECRRV